MNISDLNKDGVGLDGMDPVAAYNGEFLRGDRQFYSTFDGVTYLFANEENLGAFEEEPDTYLSSSSLLADDSREKTKDIRKSLEDTQQTNERPRKPRDLHKPEDEDVERTNLL